MLDSQRLRSKTLRSRRPRNLSRILGVGRNVGLPRKRIVWDSDLMKPVRVLLVIGAALALAACSNGSSDSATDSCDPTTTEAEPILGAEARADSAPGHEVWALFFNTWPLPPGEAVRIPVNEEVKIVWRSTGEGSLTIEADDQDGVSIEPIWGPDVHGSSNWERPGQEWGTGWIFPSTGCWTFDVSRGDNTAEMVVEVFASVAPATTEQ